MSKDLSVEVAGRGVMAHTGSIALRALADRTVPTAALSAVLARRGSDLVHDCGRFLADAAAMIADGRRVMSDPTLWRTLDSVNAHARDRLAAA